MSPSISFVLTVGVLFCFAFFFFSVSNAASLPPVVSNSVLLGNITDPNQAIYHDGGYSGVVSGHSVWLFDDTQKANPFGFWSNYAAYGNVKNPLVLNGSVGQVALGFTANEQQFNDYWCNHGKCGAIRYAVWPNSSPVQIGTNNGAVFADRVYVNSSAKNMFVSAGVAAYNFTVSGNGYPNFTRVGDEQFWTMANPKYGSAATLNIGDGYVYLYGYSTPLMFVARVPPKSAFDKTKYQFYNGKTGVWSSTIPATNDSSSAIMYDYIGSVTVFHSAYYGAYLMVYCQWDNVIRVKSAPQPWGPFTGGSDLYSTGQGPDGFTYSCAAHPEYSSAANELYLSYTWQGSAGYQNRVAKVTFQ